MYNRQKSIIDSKWETPVTPTAIATTMENTQSKVSIRINKLPGF